MPDPLAHAQRPGERLPSGTVLADRYRIESIVGAGAFGVVWRARHVHLETECALKLFDPPLGADPQDASARFLQEARVTARLKCPYVAQVFDYGVHEQMPFLVLELLHGASLASRLQALREHGRRMPPAATARILRHVAEALEVAHAAQVVHRDLKPENIFLVQEGRSYTAKVLDFGIAKWSTDAAPHLTATHTLMGTAHYMSPEQFESARRVDHRTDLWSLGVIAFECLTGRVPFPGETFIDVAFQVCRQGPLVASQIAAVPAGFDAWFARATARDREHRFASALEQALALEGICAGATRTAEPSISRIVPRLPDVAAAATSVQPARAAAEATLLRRVRGAVSMVRQRLHHGRQRLHQTLSDRLHRRISTGLLIGACTFSAAAWWAETWISSVDHHRAGGDTPLAQDEAAVDPTTRVQGLVPRQGATGVRVFGEGEGLVVSMDGSEIGPVPREYRMRQLDLWRELEPGEHEVRISGGSRYQAYESRIVVETGRVLPIGPIRLKVIQGLATIVAGKGAEEAEITLKVDGVAQPVQLPLSPAGTGRVWDPVRLEVDTRREHVIVARRRGYVTFEEPIEFEAGRAERTMEITLTPSLLSGLNTPQTPGPAAAAKGTGSGLEATAIQRTVRKYSPAVRQNCWQRALNARAPGVPSSAKVTATITVEPSGRVQSVTATGAPRGYPGLAHCIEEAVRGWTFPRSLDETVTNVPFMFVGR